MMQAVGLKTSIWNNNIRSLILIALYPLTITFIAWAIAVLCGGLMAYEENFFGWNDFSQAGTALANSFIAEWWPALFAAVGIWFFIALFFHTRMIRMLSHAKPVTRSEEPELYNLLENLCVSRGLKTPRLEIIENDALNAFASGIDDDSYAITVTRGLLDTLQQDEIEAVLAHELTHIMNNDVRLLIISIIFTGMLGFISQLYWSAIRHSLYRARGGKKDGRLFLLIFAIGAILWIGYLLTLLTRFGLSRKREYMADAGAIELTKNPDAMMRALLRISGNDHIDDAAGDIALMCIENTNRFIGLFATHPPIERRIRAISDMTGAAIPEIIENVVK